MGEPPQQPEPSESAGPSRLKSSGLAVVVAGSGLLLWLTLATVQSLIPGNHVWHTSGQLDVSASVISCARVGPVSVYGFGYWWKCRVTLHVSDGRVVNTSLGRSVVTPADVGRAVKLREACVGDGNTACGYGRHANYLWGVLVSLLRIIRGAVVTVYVVWTSFYVFSTLFGFRRVARFLGRWYGRTEPRSTSQIDGGRERSAGNQA